MIFRGNHTTADPLSGASGTHGVKLSNTRGTLVENLESYENHSYGIWFDSRNTDYTIRDSYFHDNTGFYSADGRYVRAGQGMMLEVDWPGGTLENNVFMNNESAGIALVNTSGLTVRGNLFAHNEKCMMLYNMGQTSNYTYFPFEDIQILSNHCKDWKNSSGIHTPGGSGTPADHNVFADYNTYEPVANAQFAWWPGPVYGATSIAQMQSRFGWEAHGGTATTNW